MKKILASLLVGFVWLLLAPSTNVAEGVSAGIKKLSLPNHFAVKKVKSSRTYPRGYKVKGIIEQTEILRQLFPGIGFADEKLAKQSLPPNAEGWFAIPKWETLAPTYGEAVEKVLAMIASKRKLENHRDRGLGAMFMRQHPRTAEMFQLLGDQQKGYGILVVPAQFGLRHEGRSVLRSREVFTDNEFGLGAFAVGIMLLTHPEREDKWRQLHIYCAGDELSPFGPFTKIGVFEGVPAFSFYEGVVRFIGWKNDSAIESFGSASAFLLQASVL